MFTLSNPEDPKLPGSWVVVQRQNFTVTTAVWQLQLQATVHLKFQSLQSTLVPSMHYCCELGGMHSPQAATANMACTDSNICTLDFFDTSMWSNFCSWWHVRRKVGACLL